MTADWGTFDRRYLGKRIVLAVAQEPFENNEFEFATLIPICELNGKFFDSKEHEFPTHGDVWWMLTSQSKHHAEPGRLVVAALQEAQEQGRHDRAYYQVVRDTLESVCEDQLVEVLTIPAVSVRNSVDIVHPSFTLELDHPPCAIVYAKLGEDLFGPLHAKSERVGMGRHCVRLTAAKRGRAVYRVPIAELREEPKTEAISISGDTRPTYQGGVTLTCSYTLLSSHMIDGVLSRCRSEVWKTPGEIVGDITKRLLDSGSLYKFKKERRTFLQLFDELEEKLTESPEEFWETGEKDVIQLIRNNIDHIQQEASGLALAIFDSGLIDDKFSAALDLRVDAQIEKNSATVKARIQEQTGELEIELEELETQKSALEQEIGAEKQRRYKEIDQEIQRRQDQLNDREKQIERSQASLEEDRRVTTETLESIAIRLHEGRDKTIQQFVALTPLLGEFGYARNSEKNTSQHSVMESGQPSRTSRKVNFSFFVDKGIEDDRQIVKEIEFFNRFSEHVDASGFAHRRLDLIAFHLSFKSSDIVILGGQPGTGKSSLPRLYSEALLGDDINEGSRYLHVAVSPSWVDPRDLLGFVNAFEGSFQPSESGLYMHLVNAQQEEKNRGLQSGIWVTCLDEMNLAQVEHYFGSFLQALERPPGQRLIPCFSKDTISSDSPFSNWSSLNMPSTTRFVGTVNFDETTKPLSQRLLDRANLIRLRPPRTAIDSPSVTHAKPHGKPIALSSMNDWKKRGENIPREVAEILDGIEAPLRGLGCALNPRRQRALSTFIGNAPIELCTPIQALDLQIAQRLLPRIRNLFTTRAQKSFFQLKEILEARGQFPESSYVLGEIAEESLPEAFQSED